MRKQPRQVKAKLGIVALSYIISFCAAAASVPNIFVAGTPATASEVNANFQTLVDSVTAGEGTELSGYGGTESPSGALGSRSVVVYDNGNGCYVGRGIFTNTTGETVETPSGSVTPDFIFIWQSLCGDDTSVTSETEYVYALPAANPGGNPDWENALGISINSDGDADGVFEEQGNFNYSFDSTLVVLPGMNVSSGADHYFNAANEILVATNWAYLRTVYPRPLIVNGMTFNDVVVDRFISIDRVRYRAQGIGPVLELLNNVSTDPVFGSQNQRKVIFYRQSDGVTGGSAAGTPYANGSTGMINKWFSE